MEPVSNLGEAWGVLQAGSKARVVGSTNANEHSSRSHWLAIAHFPIYKCNCTIRTYLTGLIFLNEMNLVIN